MPDTPDTPDTPDLILGVSGLRGIVGQSLTPEVAMRYAAAFGAWLREKVPSARRPCVLVANDGRFGGEVFEHAAASALAGSGCNARMLGTAMTPTVAVVCDAIEFDAALIITASHNPQEWNGIKVLVREESWGRRTASDARGTPDPEGVSACAPAIDTAEQVIDRFQRSALHWCPAESAGEICCDDDNDSKHCIAVKRAVEQAFDCKWNAMLGGSSLSKVMTDSVNASSRGIDHEFFAQGPLELVQIGAKASGLFPHPPEPTRENLSGKGGLCDAVPALHADIGFAQDPDGDRLAIIDERGRYIGEEYTLALAAESLLTADDAPKGAALVTNLSTSRLLDDVAAAHSATVHRTPVGEANVVARMKSLKAAGHTVLLGGEGNGGVIWPAVTYVRDSLSAMALTLALMARTGKTVSQLVADLDARSPAGGYHIVKRKQPLATKAHAAPALAALAKAYSAHRLDTQDGVRIDLTSGPHKGAWVHVRPSNTEPILRLIAEAGTEPAAHALLDEIAATIA